MWHSPYTMCIEIMLRRGQNCLGSTIPTPGPPKLPSQQISQQITRASSSASVGAAHSRRAGPARPAAPTPAAAVVARWHDMAVAHACKACCPHTTSGLDAQFTAEAAHSHPHLKHERGAWSCQAGIPVALVRGCGLHGSLLHVRAELVQRAGATNALVPATAARSLGGPRSLCS